MAASMDDDFQMIENQEPYHASILPSKKPVVPKDVTAPHIHVDALILAT